MHSTLPFVCERHSFYIKNSSIIDKHWMLCCVALHCFLLFSCFRGENRREKAQKEEEEKQLQQRGKEQKKIRGEVALQQPKLLNS